MYSGAQQDYNYDYHMGPLLEYDRRKLFLHGIAFISLYDVVR